MSKISSVLVRFRGFCQHYTWCICRMGRAFILIYWLLAADQAVWAEPCQIWRRCIGISTRTCHQTTAESSAKDFIANICGESQYTEGVCFVVTVLGTARCLAADVSAGSPNYPPPQYFHIVQYSLLFLSFVFCVHLGTLRSVKNIDLWIWIRVLIASYRPHLLEAFSN